MYTFKDFLGEFTTDTAALDDPQLRSDLMRRMRATGDEQQSRMDDRMQRDQQRSQRRAMQDEKDPHKKGLMRKKMQLQKQLDMINDQLSDLSDEGGEGELA